MERKPATTRTLYSHFRLEPLFLHLLLTVQLTRLLKSMASEEHASAQVCTIGLPFALAAFTFPFSFVARPLQTGAHSFARLDIVMQQLDLISLPTDRPTDLKLCASINVAVKRLQLLNEITFRSERPPQYGTIGS